MSNTGKNVSKEFDSTARQASVVELTVPSEKAGLRLDKFFAALLPQHSRSRIRCLIKDGLARVGSRIGRPSMLVKVGDVVTLVIPAPISPVPKSEAVPLEILYEDLDLLVVNKPAGMVVHPAAGHATGTLVNALLHHVSDLSGIGGQQRPGIVHRLDKGTSGLIVVAKHDASHKHLSRQFRERGVRKEYSALVWGIVQAGRHIDSPLGRDPVNRQQISTRARRTRTAVTTVIKVKAMREVSLIQVTISTGRTHQIRVHLSSIGHPVVGDALYGTRRRQVPTNLQPLTKLTRPFLHATRLTFTHPRNERCVEFTSELPQDLQETLAKL